MTVEHSVFVRFTKDGKAEVKWTMKNNPGWKIVEVFGAGKSLEKAIEKEFGFKSDFIVSDGGLYMRKKNGNGIVFNLDFLADYKSESVSSRDLLILHNKSNIYNNVLVAVKDLRRVLQLIYDYLGVKFQFNTNAVSRL